MAKDRPVALVTGGAKRVGRAIVERLSRAGFDVGFTYHSSEKEATRLVKSLNGEPLAVQVDLTKPQSACEHIYEIMGDTFGRLDVLVNNASIFEPGDKLRRQMQAIHVESPKLLCELFASQLRKSKGHVVNMIDLLAFDPPARYLEYSRTKAALADLTIDLALKLAPQVTVNGIAPGVVEWPVDYPPAARQRYLQKVPLKRSGTPQDVANLVYFLITEGTYLTGQIFKLDGGRSIA